MMVATEFVAMVFNFVCFFSRSILDLFSRDVSRSYLCYLLVVCLHGETYNFSLVGKATNIYFIIRLSLSLVGFNNFTLPLSLCFYGVCAIT